MRLVYALEEIPDSSPSVFLAGPTPRNDKVESWRPAMLEVLREVGYDGVAYLPEPRHGQWPRHYIDQMKWELEAISKSTWSFVWVPRNLDTLPGFTTNIEFGEMLHTRPDRMLYGRPDGAPKTRYMDQRYESVCGRKPSTTMNEMVDELMGQLPDN